MKHSIYVFLLITAALLAVMSSCGKSAEDQARERKQDSIDSVHRADSIYAAQTAGMLRADSVMTHRSDSLHYVWAHEAEIKRKQQAEARAFVADVMKSYIAALNSGGNPSTALGNNASNAVVSALSALNGNPAAARADSVRGGSKAYTFVSVANAKDEGWYTCTWRKGNQSITRQMKVNPNGKGHIRIDEIK